MAVDWPTLRTGQGANKVTKIPEKVCTRGHEPYSRSLYSSACLSTGVLRVEDAVSQGWAAAVALTAVIFSVVVVAG